MNKEDMQFRSIEDIDITKEEENEDESLVLEGYIAKFDVETELFDGYFEKIDRNAFDDTLADGHNIFLIYHHNYEKILCSTRNNTLELIKDDIGLKFRAVINKNLTYGHDVYELVKSGEVRGCSFGFCIDQEETKYNNQTGVVHSTLKRVSLYEGTITGIPAYKDTEVYARERNIREEERKKIEKTKDLEIRKRKLAIEIELM